MKRSFFLRSLFAVLVLVLVTPAWAAKRAEHVIIISLDGGKPAVILQSEMPNLQRLVAEGARTWTAQTIFPSITLPSHTSMLTGFGPAQHGMLENTWHETNGVAKVATIFSLAKAAGDSTAMFVGKEKFRYLLLPGSVDQFVYNTEREVVESKMFAGSATPIKEGTVPDESVAADAAAYIRQNKPNLCFIHFAGPDKAGHKHGWGSAQQIAAFADADNALGTVLEAVREAGIAGTSVIIITADHGGHDKTHGLDLPDDMIIPWIAWGRGVKQDFTITEPVTIYDTAATALWLLDVPLPANLDGKPVSSAFE